MVASDSVSAVILWISFLLLMGDSFLSKNLVQLGEDLLGFASSICFRTAHFEPGEWSVTSTTATPLVSFDSFVSSIHRPDSSDRGDKSSSAAAPESASLVVVLSEASFSQSVSTEISEEKLTLRVASRGDIFDDWEVLPLPPFNRLMFSFVIAVMCLQKFESRAPLKSS